MCQPRHRRSHHCRPELLAPLHDQDGDGNRCVLHPTADPASDPSSLASPPHTPHSLPDAHVHAALDWRHLRRWVAADSINMEPQSLPPLHAPSPPPYSCQTCQQPSPSPPHSCQSCRQQLAGMHPTLEPWPLLRAQSDHRCCCCCCCTAEPGVCAAAHPAELSGRQAPGSAGQPIM